MGTGSCVRSPQTFHISPASTSIVVSQILSEFLSHKVYKMAILWLLSLICCNLNKPFILAPDRLLPTILYIAHSLNIAHSHEWDMCAQAHENLMHREHHTHPVW